MGGATFTRLQANAYSEIGLAPGWALVANLTAARLVYEDGSYRATSLALSNPEIAVQADVTGVPFVSRLFCMAQLTVKLPYNGGGDPLVGFRQMDVEGKLRALGWLEVAHHNGYWVLDLAYRLRDGAPSDELKLETTAGLDLTTRLMALAQIFTTLGTGNGSPIPNGNNPSIDPEYSAVQSQFGVVYMMRPGRRVQLQWNRELWGRNSGDGNTIGVVMWLDF